MRRIFFLAIFSFFFFSFSVAFAENIDPNNAGNDFAVLEFDDSQISFDCTECNVEVTSTEVTGYAWGESVGWINLQPGSSGVLNDGDGNLSGYAWGENTGWINFNPTFGGVSISNGEFDGYAWAENYGWIQFDCGVSGACVETSWLPASDPDPDPDPEPEDPGGGTGIGVGNQIPGCMNSSAENYNPNATVNDGSCIFQNVIFGCTNSQALNYNPNAFFDDNSCQFGEVEIPDTPTDPTPTDPAPTDPEDTIPPQEPEDVGPIDNSSGFIGEVIQVPSYTLSKIPLDETLQILPLLLLGLSLLTLPFQQLLQAPARLFQLIFSWFGVGRKRTWGVVFDSMTKQALDPVVVSLKDATGKVIQTSITDMEGRYGFVAAPGLYSLEAHKADYVFPSEKLFGKNSDGVYDELYFGGTFQVLEEGEIITKNIPLDAINFNWNEYEKNRLGFGKKKTFMEKLQKLGTVLFVIGFIVSIIAVFISPILWNYIMLSLYIIAGIFQILGLAKHAGLASIDGIPLSFGIMRVYSNTLKKEMKKVVLDNFGNYYCLIRNGEYYITLEARNSDGTYTLVYTSDPFKVRNGSIRKKILM